MNQTLVLAALLLVSSSGCARAPSPHPRSFVVGRDGETFEQEVALRRAVYGLYGLPITFEARVRGLCPDARLAKDALDWAETRGELRGSLVGVAACMREGAMRDESLTIIAGATPDDDGIATARAERIGEALVALGVDPTRLRVDVRIIAPSTEGPAQSCSVTLQTSPSAAEERHALQR